MRRALTGMLLGWLVIVTTMSAAVWFAIDRVSRTVATGPAVVAGPIGTPTPTPTSVSATPGTPSPSPSTGPNPTPSHRPSSAPVDVAPHEPVTRVMSFGTRGGTATAACTGTRIRLIAASPVDGYRTKVDGGSRELEVEFTSERSDDVNLKLACRDGIPVQLNVGDHHDR